MNKALLTATAVAALAMAGAATAAPANWNGVYVDAGVGVGQWTGDETATFAGTCSLCLTQTQGGTGGMGTIGIGYDHQFSPRFVAGAFVDGDLTDFEGTIQDGGPFFAGRETERDAVNAGVRGGWLLGPSTMAYVDGGFSEADFSGTHMVRTFAGSATSFTTPSFSRSGWFIGAGAETAIAPGWFLRGEYRYSDYGDVSLPDTSPIPTVPSGDSTPQSTIRFHPTSTTIRAALVYKFAAGSMISTPPSPVPVSTWTGFYLNAGGGFGQWTADTTTVDLVTHACELCATQTQGGRGGFGTIGAGYDYQFNSQVVAGVFIDGDLSSISGSLQDQGPVNVAKFQQNSAWAVGARLGWLPGPSTLTYVNAGFTQAEFGSAPIFLTYDSMPEGASIPSTTDSGWFVGAGAEAALAPHWFLRGEYRFSDYQTMNVPEIPTGGAANEAYRAEPIVQTARAELVYKFN